MVKYGYIKSASFIEDNYPEILQNNFVDVDILGTAYKKICTFDHYINEADYDFIFDSEEDFETWVNDTKYPPLYKYFLIPVELIPAIKDYSGFVKQTFTELIFDIILGYETTEVEGISVVIPTNTIKLIPCNCTYWSDEGVMLLDAVIENWNVSVPSKQITFQYAFESYTEFKAFRDEKVQV